MSVWLLRRDRLLSAALVAPLLLFLAVVFVFPVVRMLSSSIYAPDVHDGFPRTVAAMTDWDGNARPPESVYAALVADLSAPADRAAQLRAVRRLNAGLPAFRSQYLRASLRAGSLAAPYRETLAALDRRWVEPEAWLAIKAAGSRVTAAYLLEALDLRLAADGSVARQPPEWAQFVGVLLKTFQIGAVVTLLCFLLGFPVAYQLAHLPANKAALLLLCVMVPFWTSLLVRTGAWVVLLQGEGAVNYALRKLALIQAPLALIYNRTGVYIAMVHVLLPFMILPLYATMRTIPVEYSRAAASLGANPAVSFFRVYVPQTLEGVFSGCLLCFVISIGYYLTPLLVGGPDDQMISYYIAFFTDKTVNWGLASALALLLITATMALYAVYARFKAVSTAAMH